MKLKAGEALEENSYHGFEIFENGPASAAQNDSSAPYKIGRFLPYRSPTSGRLGKVLER